MIAVLDASAFFLDISIAGEERFTTPSIVAELVDLSSKARYERMLAEGLQVRDPSPPALAEVMDAAIRSGDSGVLSLADREILALALELGAVLYTDDFAVQNVAHILGIPIQPIQQRTARKIRWRFRCLGCGRYYPKEGTCPICGSAIKRKIK